MVDDGNDLRTFRWQRWAIGGAVLVGLYLLLWWYPKRQCEQAEHATYECLSAIDDGGSGDPRACMPSLWLARHLPWTSKDAKSARNEDHVVRSALATAARDLDRPARDRAAAEVTEFWDDPELMWWESGAYEVILRSVAKLKDGYGMRHALVAALRIADLPALKAIAKLEPTKPNARFSRQAAALQCLFRDPGTKAALAAADRAADAEAAETFRSVPNRINDMAALDHERVAALRAVCDPSAPAVTGKFTPAQWLQVLGGKPPQPIDEGDARYNRFNAHAAVLAHNLLDDKDPQHYAVQLYAIGPHTPMGVLGGGEYFFSEDFRSPVNDDATAARVTALADAAKGDVAATLRENAYTLALSATAGWVRRGDLAKAKASLAVASAAAHHANLKAREGMYRHGLVPYLVLVGDLDTAVAEGRAPHFMLADGRTSPDDELGLAIALAAQGKYDEAFTALDPVVKRLADVSLGDHDLVDIAWLRAALALKTGKNVELELPQYMENRSSETSVGYYYRKALLTPEGRAVVRRQRRLPYFSNTSMLPAILFVVGQLAGKGDVEMWLDVVSGEQMDIGEVDPLIFAAARAEAARWRGDAAAAKQWDERFTKLRGLITDDRSDYVLHSLGE